MSYLGKNKIDKLYSYFKKSMGMYDYRNGWIKGNCPDCGKENKYGINLAMNRSNCFRCGYHERPIHVIMSIEGLDTYQQVWNLLKSVDSLDYKLPEIERFERKEVILPEGFSLLKFGESQIAKSARNYMKSRRFDIDELSMKGIGYCTKGEYFGHIILPFYHNNELIYFNARNFLNTGPKFNNPPIEKFGIGKSILMYNIDSLLIYRTVYVVESVMNAITLGDNAIALGGKKISSYQLSQLIKSPVERVILLLDPDAISDSIQLALDLNDYKKVKIVQLPQDKDVNDLGKYKTLNHVYRSRYLSYNDILKYKNSL